MRALGLRATCATVEVALLRPDGAQLVVRQVSGEGDAAAECIRLPLPPGDGPQWRHGATEATLHGTAYALRRLRRALCPRRAAALTAWRAALVGAVLVAAAAELRRGLCPAAAVGGAPWGPLVGAGLVGLVAAALQHGQLLGVDAELAFVAEAVALRLDCGRLLPPQADVAAAVRAARATAAGQPLALRGAVLHGVAHCRGGVRRAALEALGLMGDDGA